MLSFNPYINLFWFPCHHTSTKTDTLLCACSNFAFKGSPSGMDFIASFALSFAPLLTLPIGEDPKPLSGPGRLSIDFLLMPLLFASSRVSGIMVHRQL